MPVPTLIDALPDLVLLLRRDGQVMAAGGGDAVPGLKPDPGSIPGDCDALWPQPIAQLVKQLARKAIAERSSCEARFEDRGGQYVARCSAKGPDRVICVVRPLLAMHGDATLDATGNHAHPQLDRRGFLRRYRDSITTAALTGRPCAAAVIHVDGVADVSRLFDPRLAEQLLNTAILRLPRADEDAQVSWYLGQLNDSTLALVLDTDERDAIDRTVTRLCTSLRAPTLVGDAEFHLAPFSGVAILGRDAATPGQLLDRARAAANEARQAGQQRVGFFSASRQRRTPAHADIVQELRAAIASREIGLRYVGRQELATGRRVCQVGYLRWTHPLRGALRPADFLKIAETTGLATSLSRALLDGLREDYAAMRSADPGACISFGALRHHLLHEDFVADIERLLADGGPPPDRLELRIAERSFIAADPGTVSALAGLGVRLVVDEVGRGLASIDALARAPVWGLQLDRAWVASLRDDPVALKVCRAGMGVASALGLVPIATGIDEARQCESLLAIGCQLGSGDYFKRPDLTGALCVARHSSGAVR